MQSPSLNCFTETSSVASEINKEQEDRSKEEGRTFQLRFEMGGKPMKQGNTDKPAPDGRRHRGEDSHPTSGQIAWKDRDQVKPDEIKGHYM